MEFYFLCRFLFDETYKLADLTTIHEYVKQHHHLPGVPSESEIKDRGLNLGEMQNIQMQKIEELTLYLIDLNEKVLKLETETENLKKENEYLKSKLD